MIVTMAWKTLVAHPVRTAVLGVGFGLGVAVMATLLGVGEVVLEQARAPALSGGGELVVSGLTGPVTSARFVLGSVLRSPVAAGGGVIGSPRRRSDLFLVRPGAVVPVRARGGIPSLERALGDPETAGVTSWIDAPADAAWSSPDPGDVLRAMDRFHAVPDVPARMASWAEWLYFKGQTGGVQFYVTFLVGPKRPDGRRAAGVRLQVDHDGRVTTYSDGDAVDEAPLLAAAPDMTIGRSHVRLEGLRYHVTLDLPADRTGSGGTPLAGSRGGSAGRALRPASRTGIRARGEIFVDAIPGRSLAPLVIRGLAGWVSGYTVPVMSGTLAGWLSAGGERVTLSGTGYHDHNWGFWQGVSWRWGQVQHERLSYVYGRVYPPGDAADSDRIPGFLVALGPEGPVGYTTRVSIQETDDPSTGRPGRIRVEGRGGTLDLEMDLAVESAVVTRGGALASGPDFLQLRVRYHVTGRAGGQPIDFIAPGAAETFRGR
jgi:hypothetical protein